MTARRTTRGGAAVRALRRAARAWLRAHGAAYEQAGLWRYGPGLGPAAPILPARTAGERAAPGAGGAGP